MDVTPIAENQVGNETETGSIEWFITLAGF